jgi:ATP-dependent Lhr-like helicase
MDREQAVRQLLKGWMEIVGPTTIPEMMERLKLSRFDVENALVKLESVGLVLRGTFRPTATAEESKAPGGDDVGRQIEWCDRRLLQRIHRLTVGRLRKEIEPLSQQDFMRFLFRWQHVDSESRLRGAGGLAKITSMLQGWEAPAAAWEQELFPSRMRNYVGQWLEDACFSGEVTWGRLTLKDPRPVPGQRRGVEVTPAPEPRRTSVQGRAASLTFARRSDLEWLLQAARPGSVLSDGPRPWPTDLSHAANDVLKVLERRGASFFNELQSSSRRLPVEVEDALWELLSRGIVTADAVQNLRVLQSPKLRRRQRALQRGGPGRWYLLQPHEAQEPATIEEKLAWQFLNRYGVVFRDLVVREPLSPPWRELLMLYRRFEARGEVRGGRFVHGFTGEQFALPEALDVARAVRRAEPNGEVIRLAAVDPLNLTGVVTPGTRVPSMLGKYVLYRDGVPQNVDELPAEASN